MRRPILGPMLHELLGAKQTGGATIIDGDAEVAARATHLMIALQRRQATQRPGVSAP